ERLFDLALRAGRRARSWRQGPSRSLADVAVAEAERRGVSLGGRDVLVVGSGEMGRLAARAARRVGGKVRVASRIDAHAAALASGEARRVAESVAERAEREREADWEARWPRLPPLEREVRDVIEGMSRHLARRLLREPIERLGNDPDGRRERAVREAFGL